MMKAEEPGATVAAAGDGGGRTHEAGTAPHSAHRTPQVLVSCFLLGASGLIGQTAIIRELLATLGGNELIIGLALTAWLAGGALGATAGLRLRAARRFIPALTIFGCLVPATVILLRQSPWFLLSIPGELPAPGRLLALFALILPGAAVGGFLFPAGLAASGNKLSLGLRYGAEGAGAIAGGFLTVLFIDQFPNPALAGLAGALSLLAVVPVGNRKGQIAGILAAVLLLTITSPIATGLDRWRYSATRPGSSWLGDFDSPYGRLSLFRQAEQFDFFLDGSFLLSTGTCQEAEELAHVPLALLANPKKVLLIGGTLSPVPGEILRHPVESLVLVDFDPRIPQWGFFQLAQRGDAALFDPRRDPRTTWVANDPRRYLTGSGELFDCILVALPDPTTASLNRYYTAEFCQIAARHLTSDGLLVITVSGIENYMNQPLRELIRAEVRALTEAGLRSTVLPLSQTLLVASRRPVSADSASIKTSLLLRGIETQWLGSTISFSLNELRRAMVEDAVAGSGAAEPNRDRTPLSCYLTLARWFSRFYPENEGNGWVTTALTHSKPYLPAIFFSIAFFPFAFGNREKLQPRLRFFVAAVAGFATMAGQLLIMLAYQAEHGSLYREIGRLNATFMLGSVLAAGLLHRRSKPLRLAALIFVFAALYAVASTSLATQSFPPWAYFLMALGNGFIGSAVFLTTARGSSVGATLLYGADLSGAVAAAIMVIPLFLPLYSLSFTTLIVFALLIGIFIAALRLEG